MKLLEVVTMMNIEEHYQVWSVGFVIRKQGQE